MTNLYESAVDTIDEHIPRHGVIIGAFLFALGLLLITPLVAYDKAISMRREHE